MFKFFKKEQPLPDVDSGKEKGPEDGLSKMQEQIIREFKEELDKGFPKNANEKPETRLTPENKQRLIELGVDSIGRDPYFAGVCLKQAGFSEEAVRPLFEAEELISKNPKKKPETKLGPETQKDLKRLALQMFETNNPEVAKSLFKKAGLSNEEIEVFLKEHILRRIKKE